MLRAVVGSGASVARGVVGREFSGGLWSGEKRGLRRLLALPLTWPSPYLWTPLNTTVFGVTTRSKIHSRVLKKYYMIQMRNFLEKRW